MLNRINEETNKYEYANQINEETNKYEYALSNKRGNKLVRICSIEKETGNKQVRICSIE